MMAAIMAAKRGHTVTLVEQNEKLGKKLYITGKGRCNFTNACDIDIFVNNIVTNSRFMYSALKSFGPDQMIDFLNKNGCPSKIERGRRVFPLSDHASDVTKALVGCMERNGVNIRLNTRVTGIKIYNNRISDFSERYENFFQDTEKRFRVEAINNKGKMEYYDASSCIVATGGYAYPETGSRGDGYAFAESLGIGINDCTPSLGPLITKEDVRILKESRLKHVGFSIYDAKMKKTLYKSPVGELFFTHEGIGGPLALCASAYFSKSLSKGAYYNLSLDLKPGLSMDMLDKRLIRDLNTFGRKSLEEALKGLLISPIRAFVLERSLVSGEKKAALVSGSERKSIADNIKSLMFTIIGIAGFDKSIITQGGIKTDEINPKTMESKKIKGLYFVGEILDVDALTGGYNLQIAFSSGYVAGKNI